MRIPEQTLLTEVNITVSVVRENKILLVKYSNMDLQKNEFGFYIPYAPLVPSRSPDVIADDILDNYFDLLERPNLASMESYLDLARARRLDINYRIDPTKRLRFNQRYISDHKWVKPTEIPHILTARLGWAGRILSSNGIY